MVVRGYPGKDSAERNRVQCEASKRFLKKRICGCTGEIACGRSIFGRFLRPLSTRREEQLYNRCGREFIAKCSKEACAERAVSRVHSRSGYRADAKDDSRAVSRTISRVISGVIGCSDAQRISKQDR